MSYYSLGLALFIFRLPKYHVTHHDHDHVIFKFLRVLLCQICPVEKVVSASDIQYVSQWQRFVNGCSTPQDTSQTGRTRPFTLLPSFHRKPCVLSSALFFHQPPPSFCISHTALQSTLRYTCFHHAKDCCFKGLKEACGGRTAMYQNF